MKLNSVYEPGQYTWIGDRGLRPVDCFSIFNNYVLSVIFSCPILSNFSEYESMLCCDHLWKILTRFVLVFVQFD